MASVDFVGRVRGHGRIQIARRHLRRRIRQLPDRPDDGVREAELNGPPTTMSKSARPSVM
jgi:hypothetical protein